MDRFGRKAAFLTLYAGFLLGTLFCGLAPGFHTLLLARVITGGFGGLLSGMARRSSPMFFPKNDAAARWNPHVGLRGRVGCRRAGRVVPG